jgi:CheY-like chemotaxis protein
MAPHDPASDRPLRVLVADNDRGAADNLAAVIGSWGHVTQAVYGGPEALEMAWIFQPDAALLDFGMPDLNGGQVAQALRSRPGARPLLVAVTGYSPQWVSHLYPAAFDRCLLKPVALPALQALLAAARKLPDA